LTVDDNSDDPRTPADKDSTGQNHKKKNEISKGTARMTPMGNVTVKGTRQVTVTVQNEELPDRIVQVDLSRNDINHEEKMLGVNVLLRIDELGSNPNGIDGGRITRMTLTKGEKGDEDILAHFDNGKWVEKAETPLAIQVKMRIMKQENGLKMPEVKPSLETV